MTTHANANSPGFLRRHRPPEWVSVAGHVLEPPLILFVLLAPFLPSSYGAPIRAAFLLFCIANFATIMWHPSRRPEKERVASSALNAYFSAVFLALILLVVAALVIDSLDAFR